MRPDKRLRQGFKGAPGAKKVRGSLTCSLPEGGQSGFLPGVRIEAGPEVRLKGWLGWSAHCSGDVMLRGRGRGRDDLGE